MVDIKIEPIEPIEAYKCNICNGVIFGNKENALRHANTPTGLKFPAGFVYKTGFVIEGKQDQNYDYAIILPKSELICGEPDYSEPRRMQRVHTYDQSIAVFGFFNPDAILPSKSKKLEWGWEELSLMGKFMKMSEEDRRKVLQLRFFNRINSQKLLEELISKESMIITDSELLEFKQLYHECISKPDDCRKGYIDLNEAEFTNVRLL